MINVEYANLLRIEEIKRVLVRHGSLFAGKDLLEIGSGTGVQLRLLAQVCKSAAGIELPDSAYRRERQGHIIEYDGQRIPFPDGSFDVVFSSNVIEHIKDEKSIHAEIRRVLRPAGVALHVVPTSNWRLWTSVIHYAALPRNVGWKLKRASQAVNGHGVPAFNHQIGWGQRLLNALVAPRHGEFGNRLSEYLLFRPAAWRRRFEAHGWQVEAVDPLGLAYSGYSLFATRLSISARTWSARIIGSSTVLFVLRPR
jgi:SAM-dependent methyltransferase